MKSTTTWNANAARDLIARSYAKPAQARSQVRKAAPSLFYRLTHFLSGNTDPLISRTTRKGYRVWDVIDPSSKSEYFFYSEADIRHWLEQRYYD